MSVKILFKYKKIHSIHRLTDSGIFYFQESSLTYKEKSVTNCLKLFKYWCKGKYAMVDIYHFGLPRYLPIWGNLKQTKGAKEGKTFPFPTPKFDKSDAQYFILL